MVKLRLKRFGRRHRPFFRLNAMDIRVPRNGMSIEELGTYDPLEKDLTKAIQFDADRVKYWLSVGAQPSETVVSLLKKSGIVAVTPYTPPKGAKAPAAPEAQAPAPTA